MYRRFSFILLLVVIKAGCESTGVVPETNKSITRVQEALVDELENSDELVDVIINFRKPTADFKGKRRTFYRHITDRIVARHNEGLSVTRRFVHVPALAARINRSALETLRNDPTVEYIQLDGKGYGALLEAVPAIGADQVKQIRNLTGNGVHVAVLDTGASSQHPDLRDSIVAEHCFTQNDCPPMNMNEGSSAEDDHGHGSNVSGIIASQGIVASAGFAPGVGLVSVKINDWNNSGMVSDWIAGLDWIYENLDTLQVKVINMSLCTNALYTDTASCDRGEPAMAAAVKNLADAGVTIFACSGNLGLINQLSAPACNTGVIAVAATYDSNVGRQPESGLSYRWEYGSFAIADCSDLTTDFDQITCFSNTPSRVDLVAPGAPMTSVGLNNSTSVYRGTSQASPVAAGVAALMLECNPSLTPDQIKQYMVDTGVDRTDIKSNLTFPSLRAFEAVEAACFANTNNDAGGTAGTGAGEIGGVDAGSLDGGKTETSGSGGSTTIDSGSASTSNTAASGAAGSATTSNTAASGAGGSTGFSGTTVSQSTGGVDNPVVPTPTGTGFGAGAGDDGCGCRVARASHHKSSTIPSIALLVLAIFALMLRKRPRSKPLALAKKRTSAVHGI